MIEGEKTGDTVIFVRAFIDNDIIDRRFNVFVCQHNALGRSGGSSGDVGVFDESGYLYIVDRIKDMIITGGENVYSREVEEILYTLPQIEECAVIGLPDQEWGERVTAVLTLKEGKLLDQAEVTTLLKTKLSSFKVPKDFITVGQLPKSAAGKILKRELRDQFLKKT